MTLAYAAPPSPSRRLIAPLAFAALVSLGLPDGVLGVAWPSLRHAFGLPVSRMGVILTANVCGSLVSSFLGGQILRALGVGRLLLFSCIAVVVGLTFIAFSPAWHFVVAGALIAGLGGGIVTGLMSNSKEKSAQAKCNSVTKVCDPSAEPLFDDARTFADASTVLLIGGGALTAVGIGLIIGGYASSPSSEQTAQHLQLVPVLSGNSGGVVAMGTF